MIKIQLPKEEGLNPLLKFKDLHKAEYIIASLSVNYDEPLEGLSSYAKDVNGKWYLYELMLHEYLYLDDNAEKHIEKPEILVGRFEADNQYKDKKTGQFIKTQGTILKFLQKAEPGVKFKITMVENKKGKKVYTIESLGEKTNQEKTVEDTPVESNEQIPLAEFVQNMKKQGVDLATTTQIAKKNYTTNDASIKALYDM